jgi:DNA invertase Pin-like site-specific DNA recombinase
MKAIILARVSTEEQKDAGNSLPAQIERIKAYCARKNLDVSEDRIFSFDESAYKQKRDEFDGILEYLKQHKEKVAACFDKVDRLSRNVFDKRVSMLYEKAVADEIEIHFVSDGQIINNSMSAVQKFQFGMSLGLAKYYSDAISDNVKRAFEQKRRNGEWTGPVRIGYKNVSLDVKKRLRKDIVLDDENAHLIKALFDLWATGNYSNHAIWLKITEMGLKNKAGKRMARSNIVYILKDSFYCGIARSKYGSYEHHYPRIITRELFDKCQQVFENRGRKPSKIVSKADYIFQGLLICKDCGCLYTPERHKGNNYYSCTDAKHVCKRVYVNEKVLLKPIYDVLNDFETIPQDVQDRLTKELRKAHDSEAEYHNGQVIRIRAEYDRWQKRSDALINLLADQSITKDEYDRKQQEAKDKQHLLNIELEEHTKADSNYKVHVATVFNLARSMKEIFESSENIEKRAFLNFLLQNPTVSAKKIEFTLRKPFNLILELAHSPLVLQLFD